MPRSYIQIQQMIDTHTLYSCTSINASVYNEHMLHIYTMAFLLVVSSIKAFFVQLLM